MRILVPIAYYTPEIAGGLYLETDLLEDMAGHGWDIDIYAPMPSRGVDTKTRRKYRRIRLETQYNEKLKIHRFYIPPENDNVFLRFARYMVMNTVFLWKGFFCEADLILVGSTPPTQGAMGALLKKLKNIPMVYILQDVFPDSLINAGLIKQESMVWKLGRLIENFTYRNADKIITISEDFKDNIAAKGVPEERIEIIYNWVDEKAVVYIDRDRNELFRKYDLDIRKFYITHCGNIGFTQNMDMLLDVAHELEEYQDIEFVLVGDGSYRTVVEKIISDNNIKNVKLIPFQPYEDISKVFSIGNIGLIISKPNVGQNSVPCKTWSIMSAVQPILASFDLSSELCRIIENSESGLCVQAGEKEKLKEAIIYLYNNREKSEQMGINGRKFVLNNLTRNMGTSKYIKVIKQIIGE